MLEGLGRCHGLLAESYAATTQKMQGREGERQGKRIEERRKEKE